MTHEWSEAFIKQLTGLGAVRPGNGLFSCLEWKWRGRIRPLTELNRVFVPGVEMEGSDPALSGLHLNTIITRS